MAKTVTHKGEEAFFGEGGHLQVSKSRTFSEMVFDLLSTRRPTKVELAIFDLILNLSIDHGPDTPSSVAVVEAGRAGKTISESVAAGIAQINDVHGGAIEPAMEVYYKSIKEKIGGKEVVGRFLKEDKRIPGYGHRIYTNVDPRAELILKTLEEEKIGLEYIKVAREIERELEARKGRQIPLNIDGAIAVSLCAFEWDPKLGKALFIIARTPGLCGQFLNLQK